MLRATDGYPELDVEVDEGVVILDGTGADEKFVDVATKIAGHTEGVVAVVNHLDVARGAWWDLRPARDQLLEMSRSAVAALPSVALGLVLVVLGALAGRVASRGARPLLRDRIGSTLLREVAARAIGVAVFLLGLYLALRLAGLTRLAVTLIGGTGLVGLVVGIAFRGITENFLASLFLSLQQPFREGDLVVIGDATGFVQRLTSRATLLTTLDGTQVLIPNATVFGSVVRNHTSIPNRREDFVVGVGYETAIPDAQRIALDVLHDHPVVLDDPEPWVLVDRLGAATVDLRLYFWFDGTRHHWLKVRSSVMRLVKRAFQEAGISMPDEAREIVFPDGVPVRHVEEAARPTRPPEVPEAATTGEGDLLTDARDLDEQARRGWSPDAGDDLLRKR